MIAMLGDVSFAVVKGGITALRGSHNVRFARHDVFQGKPQTQAIGVELSGQEIVINLNYKQGAVKKRIDQLLTMMQAQEPVSLVMGNGRFVGLFVIDSADEVSEVLDDRGGLMAAELSLKLTEFDGELPPDTPKSGIVEDILGALGASEETIAAVNEALDTVEQVIDTVTEVIEIATDVVDVVERLRESGNPLSDLVLLGGPLGRAAEYCNDILGFNLPDGEWFDNLFTEVGKAGGYLGNIRLLADQAIGDNSIIEYISPLELNADNLNTVAAAMQTAASQIMVDIAMRNI